MATVQLTNVIIPEVYESYTAVDNPELTAFFESGIAVRNGMLDAKANEGGDRLFVPFWNDLDPDDEPNLSSDNPSANATPKNIVAGKQIAQMAYLNQAYSATDLAAEVAGSDPMQRVRNRFGRYWQRQWQRRTLACLSGILADNVANDDSDMVEDVSIADGDNAAAANLFSREAFTGAGFTLGDRFQDTTAIAVHSVVYKRMVDNDDVEFIPDSQGQMTIPTFMGRRVIVDDGMPVVAGGTSGFVFTSILFGTGAIGYGEGAAKVPVELDRNPLQGNGGGVESLIERKSWLIHPFGFAIADDPGGVSFTLSELKEAATWDRVVPRKNVPISFLLTNG